MSALDVKLSCISLYDVRYGEEYSILLIELVSFRIFNCVVRLTVVSSSKQGNCFLKTSLTVRFVCPRFRSDNGVTLLPS